MKLNAGDLYVIADTLRESLNIVNYGSFSPDSRARVMKRVVDIMSNMEVEIVAGKTDPVAISGDLCG